ncbi:MAG: CDP-2,3-bis-(O-geranylgeranyl)-sn-glycerol synthase [Candidatus Caldarchaeum sp.]|nr:CDP-2,3-bis-(O-geranylgeranyl)-sn-glycerol synthase [Candidatus Caldarchaeum sp.]
MDVNSFLHGLGYVFPAYVSNATPVVAVKLLKKATPIDGGKNFPDGRRILGDGKTFEGLVSGVSAGFAVGAAMNFLFPWLFSLLEVFLLSLGAMIGDIVGAFFKRRMGLKQGSPAPVLDQTGFLAAALLLVHLLTGLPKWLDASIIAALFVFTVFMHLATNGFAYIVGLKDKWY